MEQFNKALYDEAVTDFSRFVKSTQTALSEKLKGLEIELTDDLWIAFASSGVKKIREIAFGKITSNNSIYSAKIDTSPIRRVLSEIEILHNTMIISYHSNVKKCNLIPLNATGIDGKISSEALKNLKSHCTSVMDDELYKALESFIKSYNLVNQIAPQSLEIDSRYLEFTEAGVLEITFKNL